MKAPRFEGDREKTRIARLLNAVLLSLLPLIFILALLATFALPQVGFVRVATLWTTTALSLVFLVSIRLGYVRIAAVLMLVLNWLVFSFAIFRSGGIRMPAFGMFIVSTLLAGLLLGARAGMVAAATAILTGWVFLQAEQAGRIVYSADSLSAEAAFAFNTALILYAATVLIIYLSQLNKATAQLGASESRYKNIFESAHVAIIEQDFTDVKRKLSSLALPAGGDIRTYLESHGDFVRDCYLVIKTHDCNNAAVSLFEAQSCEHLIQQRGELVSVAGERGFHNLLVDLYEGRHVHVSEVRRQTFKGRWLDLVIGIRIADSAAGLKHVVAVVRDITAEKRANSLAQHSTARLAKAETIANAGNWSYDLRTNDIEWSDGLFRLVGLEPGSIQLTYKTLLERILPQDRDAYRELFGSISLLAKSPALENLEYRIKREDGEIRVLSVTFEIEKDPEGSPARLFGTALDVTPLKSVEAELQRYQNHLKDLIDEQTDDLNLRIIEVENLNRVLRSTNKKLEQTARELSTANQEMESFSYTVSHDLRSPLRHINGYLGMLKEARSDHIGKSGLALIEKAGHATGQMRQLIDDLLAFSQTGRAELILEPVDLGTLARSILKDYEDVSRERSIEWEIEGLPVVAADKNLVGVVVRNLISNAIKFTASKRSPMISIGVTRPAADMTEGSTVLYVQDNGVGFDPRYGHKLFGVFERLHNAEDYEGTGIGLATVRRIIHAHGGRVWAEGEVGQGATFYCAFPEPTSIE
jgi:PAS domain S-box-containing protein